MGCKEIAANQNHSNVTGQASTQHVGAYDAAVSVVQTVPCSITLIDELMNTNVEQTSRLSRSKL